MAEESCHVIGGFHMENTCNRVVKQSDQHQHQTLECAADGTPKKSKS